MPKWISACVMATLMGAPSSFAQEPSLNVTNVPLPELLRTASKVLNKSYSSDKDLCSRFSIVVPRNLTAKEAQLTFEAALLSHGYTLVSRGRSYHVRSVRSPGSEEFTVGCHSPLNDVVTRLFRMRSISTTAASRLVLPFMSRDVMIEDIEETRSLILSDEASHIEKARHLLKSRDPGADI